MPAIRILPAPDDAGRAEVRRRELGASRERPTLADLRGALPDPFHCALAGRVEAT
jgi:hypothetical protein